jgi:hypothetical protein
MMDKAGSVECAADLVFVRDVRHTKHGPRFPVAFLQQGNLGLPISIWHMQ